MKGPSLVTVYLPHPHPSLAPLALLQRVVVVLLQLVPRQRDIKMDPEHIVLISNKEKVGDLRCIALSGDIKERSHQKLQIHPKNHLLVMFVT